jgi:hypothetical protein
MSMRGYVPDIEALPGEELHGIVKVPRRLPQLAIFTALWKVR